MESSGRFPLWRGDCRYGWQDLDGLLVLAPGALGRSLEQRQGRADVSHAVLFELSSSGAGAFAPGLCRTGEVISTVALPAAVATISYAVGRWCVSQFSDVRVAPLTRLIGARDTGRGGVGRTLRDFRACLEAPSA